MSPVSRGRKTRKGRARGRARDAPVLRGVRFGEEDADPGDASVGRLYLAGVDPDDPVDLQAILDRRMLALPA